MSESHPKQIFQAENPTRWRATKWTIRVLLFSLLFVLVVVCIGVLRGLSPGMPNMTDIASSYKKVMDPTEPLTISTSQNNKYKGFKDILAKKNNVADYRKNEADTSVIRAAFYTPWSSLSLPDLKLNGSKLNTIYPEWFFIDTLTYKLQTRIDSAGLMAMKGFGLSIQPILNNFHSGAPGFFDGEMLGKILHNKPLQDSLIKQLIDTLDHYQLQGVNIDFEEITESSNDYLNDFQKNLYEKLHARNKLVSMDVQAGNTDYDVAFLENYVDHFILMAYDQYNDASSAGPISAQKWIEAQVDIFNKAVTNDSKIILGIAGYGRKWTSDGEEKWVEDISYNQAIDQAKISGSTIRFDNDSYNLYYQYDFTGKVNYVEKNTVWFTDAATAFNVCRFSDDYRMAGTALWRLGGEDQRLWTFYNRDLSTPSLTKNPFDYNVLKDMPASFDKKPSHVGEGELINILNTPQQGKINFEIDPVENLIAEQEYLQLPSGYVYEKFAEDTTPLGPGHKIILTFDDGPDPKYTPQILDILEREKVPATFFIVGINAEANIPLLQRISKAGYEIGNHSFTHGNMAKMSPERAMLELKATRSLIEAVTGRSVILFRAPYNADSEPQTYEEIEPIARSKQENYITVGESIDPNDWDPKMNADSIVSRTIRIANSNNASIILLHDAGGESREATIEALPRIIEYFKKRGCEFTTVAKLMGSTDNAVMPPVTRSLKNRLNFFFASATYWASHILFALFIVGILLSIGRMVAMAILASIQASKEKKTLANLQVPAQNQKVSIIVPAYNEEVNAVRTVNSLLKQNYPNLDVVFVDDGSKDDTYKKVSEAFASNPSVKVFTKPNGGKASALNFGIANTNSEFVVCIDADTQLKEDAVSELMKTFYLEADPEDVGAVAGNVKVGNEINMLTKWQSIEYITSQNFDRRAFSLLDCITVVPGAIGAFRRQAILDAGGFTTDTLAEDCDLTMRMHRSGYMVANCNQAISYTEAPERLSQFLKQRFRWSFGVMQCFWKHRDTLFRKKYGGLGMIAMPNILLFQMILPFLAPLADIILLLSILASALGLISADISHIIIYYIIFSLVDLAGAALAFAFEKEDYKKLLWMIPQRLVYRQLMYYILFKSVRKAVKGELQGWGVLKRTGNVKASTT